MVYTSQIIKNICGIQLYTISKGSLGLISGLINDIFTKRQVRIDFQPILKIFLFQLLVKFKTEGTPTPHGFSCFLYYFKRLFTSEHGIFQAA